TSSNEHATGPAKWLAPRATSTDQSLSQRLGDGFRLGVHLQFLVDAAHMEGDRVDAHVELGGGALVIVPINEQLEQPRLVWRQVIVGVSRRTNLAKEVDDPARDLRRHRRAAVDDFLD